MSVVDTRTFARMVAEQARRRPRRYTRPGDLAEKLDRETGKRSPALEKIDDALVELMKADTEENALAVFMPPQEGKSQRVSRRFAEWLLDHNPKLRIAIVSYEQDTALRWGRDIKMDIAQNPCPNGGREKCHEVCGGLHIRIRQDTSAAGRWETPQGGGVYCVGVGGPLTGRPVDVLIVDDPVKDRSTAESETIRKSTWDWWESVALTRLAPNARVVLIQTRWHEDDLAGRIASRPSPLRWRTLRIPAICDDPVNDPLHRALGEELPSVRRRAAGYFYNLQQTMSPYVFAGVYQQSPTAAEGNFFRRQSFRYWRHMEPWPDGRQRILCEGEPVTLVDCSRYITMDFAASTKTSADYTVASMWAVTPAGHLILLDRERDRVPDHQHFDMAQRLRQRWGECTIYAEQNWWSSTFTQDANDNDVGVAPAPGADKDKLTRAIPAAGRVHSGRVWFPADAPWLAEWENELAIFPQGTHDDQVDTLSYAVRVQISEWTLKAQETPGRQPGYGDIMQAATAATGYSGGIDPMSVAY